MAFNKGNLYNDGNSEESFISRVNPLANAANAEILKIEECGSCEIELAFTAETTGGETTFTFAAPTTDYDDITGLSIQITDGEGNFVTTTEEPTLDTSALNQATQWIVTIYLERDGNNKLVGCVCSKKFSFGYNPALGLTVNTQEIGTDLRISADGDTYNSAGVSLGTFPAGSSETVNFWVKNFGTLALNVQNPAYASPILSVAASTPPNVIFGDNILFPEDVKIFQITIDTGGGLGPFLATLTFDLGDVVVEFQVTFTVV